jgi:hypothetical protein
MSYNNPSYENQLLDQHPWHNIYTHYDIYWIIQNELHFIFANVQFIKIFAILSQIEFVLKLQIFLEFIVSMLRRNKYFFSLLGCNPNVQLIHGHHLFTCVSRMKHVSNLNIVYQRMDDTYHGIWLTISLP